MKKSCRKVGSDVPIGRFPFLVHMDQVELFREGYAKVIRAVTLVDSYSRFAMALVLNQAATSVETSELVSRLMTAMHVIPRVVVTDSGTEFRALFSERVGVLGIRHVVVPPYSQDLNGLVERFHGTLKTIFRAHLLEKQQFGSREVQLQR